MIQIHPDGKNFEPLQPTLKRLEIVPVGTQNIVEKSKLNAIEILNGINMILHSLRNFNKYELAKQIEDTKRINTQDKYGNTCLMYCIFFGLVDEIKFLTKLDGLKKDIPNKSGKTAYDIAAECKDFYKDKPLLSSTYDEINRLINAEPDKITIRTSPENRLPYAKSSH